MNINKPLTRTPLSTSSENIQNLPNVKNNSINSNTKLTSPNDPRVAELMALQSNLVKSLEVFQMELELIAFISKSLKDFNTPTEEIFLNLREYLIKLV